MESSFVNTDPSARSERSRADASCPRLMISSELGTGHRPAFSSSFSFFGAKHRTAARCELQGRVHPHLARRTRGRPQPKQNDSSDRHELGPAAAPRHAHRGALRPVFFRLCRGDNHAVDASIPADSHCSSRRANCTTTAPADPHAGLPPLDAARPRARRRGIRGEVITTCPGSTRDSSARPPRAAP
jgi:hypothetical protein